MLLPLPSPYICTYVRNMYAMRRRSILFAQEEGRKTQERERETAGPSAATRKQKKRVQKMCPYVLSRSLVRPSKPDVRQETERRVKQAIFSSFSGQADADGRWSPAWQR
ncbi:hypothetical protein B0I35DRAFT_439958 [Stachybotrys elegans]|uniref:Uncharacterized protein n=1 Tax=Stachybotrys elegans TaxID=80388 RepID=A0A8K0WMC4_9HYPO|nr:hypothetical protein B0I35DRAFT_439958 [Stachybotrys elegans]